MKSRTKGLINSYLFKHNVKLFLCVIPQAVIWGEMILKCCGIISPEESWAGCFLTRSSPPPQFRVIIHDHDYRNPILEACRTGEFLSKFVN